MALTFSLYADALLPESQLTPFPETQHNPPSPSITCPPPPFTVEPTDASGFYPGELSDLIKYLGDSELHQLHANDEKSQEKQERVQEGSNDQTTFWTSAVTNWEKVDRQIWSATHEYLTRVKGFIHETVTPPVPAFASSMLPSPSHPSPASDIQSSSLLLHALQASSHSLAQSSLQIPHHKVSSKNHTTVRLFLPTEKCLTEEKRRDREVKLVFRTKAKTGRKPKNYECFKCHMNLPYKRNLIYHLRDEHHIYRSQSLLYKRLNQDPAEMKRLYGGPN